MSPFLFRCRSESLDALAVDRACAPVPSVARLQWACVARPVQSVSHRARCASPDSVALHRTESRPGASRGPSRRLAMVERSGLERIRARPLCGSWTGGTPAPMARLGERGDGGDRHPTDPTERESRRAVRYGRMDGGDGGAVGVGCEPSTHRPPAETGGNVECPRSFSLASIFLFDTKLPTKQPRSFRLLL